MTFAAGTRVGPYEIVGPLGAGAMGEVYRARDTRLGREVALKVLPAEVAGDAARRARFEQEARAVAALNHPNIVAIYDVGENYLVTELVDGEPLRGARFNLRKTIDTASQIADGLAAAHAAGITHRDLKPDNVMVTREGRVKILDFGLAKLSREAPSEVEDTLTIAQTQPGTVMGTVGYMSPEQVRGQKADHRADIFSFGVILYELLSGNRAFQRGSAAETMTSIVKDDPPELPETAPSALRQIVGRCLEKAPARRFQSASDLAFALRAVAGPGSTSPATTVPVAPRRRLRAGPILFTMAGALGGALVSLWLVEPRTMDYTSQRYKMLVTEQEGPGSPAISPDGKTIAYSAPVDGVSQIFVRPIGVPASLQLTKETALARYPFWSPDGSRVYYVRFQSNREVWSVSAAGGVARPLMTGVGGGPFTDGFAISRDGKALAVAKEEKPGGLYAVYVSSPPGSPPTRYPGSPTFQPITVQRFKLRFSPDGRKLLVLFMKAGSDPEYWVLPWPEGKPRRVLPTVRNVGYPSFGDWMPDNRHLVLALGKDRGDPHLWLGDTDTGGTAPLTWGRTVEEEPAVSLDGKSIVFVSPNRNADLVEIPVDGSPMRDLLATPLSEGAPSWSPVAPQYVYVNNENEIWLKSHKEELHRPLVTPRDLPGERILALGTPVFSPDGRRVAFAALGDWGSKIWVAPVAGGSPVRLTPEPSMQVDEVAPSWSPDGEWIAYVTWRQANRQTSMLAKSMVGTQQQAVPIRQGLGQVRFQEWSPTGEWISVQLPEGFGLISPGGDKVRLLQTDYDASGTFPHAWSKDGSELYVIYRRERRTVMAVIDVGTGRETRAYEVGKDVSFEAFYNLATRLSRSPDGKSFATSIARHRPGLWLLEGVEPAPRLGGRFAFWGR